MGTFAKSRKKAISFVMFVRPSVRLSACISPAPTGRIYVKYYTGDFYGNICRHNPNLVTDGQKYQALQMKN